jgi:cytochrome c553
MIKKSERIEAMMSKLMIAACGGMMVLASGAALAHGDYAAGQAKSKTCAACHGADGNSTVPNFPKLAGQQYTYIIHALKAYRSGDRKNPIMGAQAKNLSDQDIEDLAMYFSRQHGLVTKY